MGRHAELSTYNKPEVMKIHNLVTDSLKFPCLVASCPSSRQFQSRQAQIGHYRLFHPALLLQCEFEECQGSDNYFTGESDREEHCNSRHLRVLTNRPHLAGTPKESDEPEARQSEHVIHCTDGLADQQKGQTVPRECEALKIKIEDSSDSEGGKMQSL
jgi:hypothetical protein